MRPNSSQFNQAYPLILFLVILSFKHPLNSTNRLSSSPKNISKTEMPSSNPNCVNEEVYQSPITNAEAEEDTKVPPLVIWRDIQRIQIINSRAKLAVSTIRSRTRIRKVARRSVGESSSVGATGQSWLWVEICCFVGGAADRGIVECCGKDTANPVGGRVKLVQPVAPEDG
jgi:hypothetical protein